MPDYMKDYRLTKEDSVKGNTLSTKCLENGRWRVLKCYSIVKDPPQHDVFIVTVAVSVLCGRTSIKVLKTGQFGHSRKGSYACTLKGAAKEGAMILL